MYLVESQLLLNIDSETQNPIKYLSRRTDFAARSSFVLHLSRCGKKDAKMQITAQGVIVPADPKSKSICTRICLSRSCPFRVRNLESITHRGNVQKWLYRISCGCFVCRRSLCPHSKSAAVAICFFRIQHDQILPMKDIAS